MRFSFHLALEEMVYNLYIATPIIIAHLSPSDQPPLEYTSKA